ncbi:MAG: hypothetical protein KIH69_003645 [Anaerolineae bacterium]|nr:hypothetical protein [Anaerolineae bacterium]
MTTPLTYTLLSDGSSDWTMRHILNWLLRKHGLQKAVHPQWADLRKLRKPPSKLNEKIEVALRLYPCQLLFIHRDSENQSREKRIEEILAATKEIKISEAMPPIVYVIPIRMQEAWLLGDEKIIRRAAGNPNGKINLNFPQLSELEDLPDPKERVFNLLREASELGGRRRRDLNVHQLLHRIAELTDDFSPLEQLSAFRMLSEDVKQIVKRLK